MCLGVPGRIIEPPDAAGTAAADVRGRPRRVSCLMLVDGGDVAVDQWVLIHMGLAIERLDDAEARELLAVLDDPTPRPPQHEGGVG